jgi:hypothetical protein
MTTRPTKKLPKLTESVTRATKQAALTGTPYDARLDRIKLTTKLRTELLNDLMRGQTKGPHSALARLDAKIFEFGMKVIRVETMRALREHGSPFATMEYDAFMAALPERVITCSDVVRIYLGMAYGKSLSVRHADNKPIWTALRARDGFVLDSTSPLLAPANELRLEREQLEQNLQQLKDDLTVAVGACKTLGSFFTTYPGAAAGVSQAALTYWIDLYERDQVASGRLIISPATLDAKLAALRVE